MIILISFMYNVMLLYIFQLRSVYLKDVAKQSVICDISHAVILRRSDKRKDRVEISPEMLIQVCIKLDFSFYS